MNKVDTLCTICNLKSKNYKCPKCYISYCSIECYKSKDHLKEHNQIFDEKKINIETGIKETIEDNLTSIHSEKELKFAKILEDKKIKYLLKDKVLQFHLLTLIKILIDPTVTKVNHKLKFNDQHNDNFKEKSLIIMNLKLNDLRAGGIEENEVVEEFVQRFFFLYNSK